MLWHMSESHSFLWPDIPLYEYITYFYSSFNGHIVPLFGCFIYNAAMTIPVQVFI